MLVTSRKKYFLIETPSQHLIGYVVSWLGAMASSHPFPIGHCTGDGAMAARAVVTSHRGRGAAGKKTL
ncbi:hypothetical protein Tco_1074119 [Tanacetum coccineum]